MTRCPRPSRYRAKPADLRAATISLGGWYCVTSSSERLTSRQASLRALWPSSHAPVVDLLVFVAGAGLVAATAVLVVSIASPRGLATTFTGLAVAGYGTVVLAGEATSLVGQFGRGGLLVAHVVLLALAFGGWIAAGRPPFPVKLRPREAIGVATAAARRDPLVGGLCAIAVAVMAYQLVVGLIAAPTNWDSMTYHLSRAAYWLQEGGAMRFDGGSLRQLDSMPNAEIATAWTMAMSGRDTFVELVQWTALAACVPAIVGLARLLGATKAQSLAAAALFVILPMPVLQSVTTQNDLVAAACITGSALLAARGLRDAHVGTLALAGAAVGLGLGSKGTVLFALPAIAVIVAVAASRARPSRATLVTGAACLAAGFVAFGAFQYVQNLADTGDPFGGQGNLVGRSDFSPGENAALVLWNFVDSPGVSVPVADRVFERTVSHVARYEGDVPMRLGTDVDHDRVSGGLVGWLVLWPVALGILLLPGMRREWRAQAGAAVLFALTIAVMVKATIFNGRILLPFLALSAPLLAVVARNRAALAVTSVLALAALVSCLTVSPSHVLLPSSGQQAFFNADRLEQMTAMRPDQAGTIRYVNDRFGDRAPLLVIAGEDSWEYPYFGPRRERRIERASPDDVPDERRSLCAMARARGPARAGRRGGDARRTHRSPGSPPATGPVKPSGANFVLDARQVRRGCSRA